MKKPSPSQKILVGIDEVGRGTWAWPVVACACVFLRKERLGKILPLLKDSKKISAPNREKIAQLLSEAQKQQDIDFALGQASTSEIDAINIRNATALAMRRAFEKLQTKNTYNITEICIDGKDAFVVDEGISSTAIVGGDGKVAEIMAASIVAKVFRDHLMGEMQKDFPQFTFGIHKGYGTQKHLTEIQTHGICTEHRTTFRPIREHLETSSQKIRRKSRRKQSSSQKSTKR